MSLPSIMNLPTFSAKPKLKSSFLIVLITSKLIWKKMLNLQLALYTHFQHLNKKLLRNSLRKTSIWVLSNQLPLCMVYQSYLLRRKMVHYAFVSTSVVLTIFPKRIAIYSCSFLIYWTHLVKLRFIQRWIFTMLTTWFASLIVINGRPLLEHIIDHSSSLSCSSILLILLWPSSDLWTISSLTFWMSMS